MKVYNNSKDSTIKIPSDTVNECNVLQVRKNVCKRLPATVQPKFKFEDCQNCNGKELF